MAYAFALAGDQAKRNELLRSLDKEAMKDGKNCHFKNSPLPITTGQIRENTILITMAIKQSARSNAEILQIT